MANDTKQVMDIRPGKGMTVGQSDEHQRNWTAKGWDWAVSHGNYDPARETLNFEVSRDGKIVPVDKSKTIPKKMAEILAGRGIKDPNEGLAEPKFRTVVNIIFGGNRGRMHELAFGSQKVDVSPGVQNPGLKRMPEIEQWALDMYRFSCNKWGKENIISFIVHLDEMNPHIHATVLPIDKAKQRISFNSVFGGNIYAFKEYITSLHDELAIVNRKWGLERGTNILETGARHRSTEEYRRELSRDCTSLEEAIRDSAGVLFKLQKDIRFAEKRVKGLSTMIANLNSKKESLTEEIQRLKTEVENGRGNTEELASRISHLDLELQKVLASLSDKQEKLAVADNKLAELRQLEEDSKRQTEDYRNEIKQATHSMEKQIRFRISDALLSDLCSDFISAYSDLPPESQKMFEDTMIKDMAERGEDIIRCAVFLYANYVDFATTFAEGHGGGGGDTDLPWGRKEDEDDLAWARRCFLQAHKMMRPSGGKNIRRK